MPRLLLIAVLLVLCSPAIAQEITLADLAGQWYGETRLADGTVITNNVVINGSEWTSNNSMYTKGYFGPVTYNSAQGGTVELFPPATLRFAVFWQQPNEINGRGIMLNPGSSFTIEDFSGRQLVLVDELCARAAPRNQCAAVYQRVR